MKKLQKLQKVVNLNEKQTSTNSITSIIENVGGIQETVIKWMTGFKTTKYGGDSGQFQDSATTGYGDMDQWYV